MGVFFGAVPTLVPTAPLMNPILRRTRSNQPPESGAWEAENPNGATTKTVEQPAESTLAQSDGGAVTDLVPGAAGPA